MKTIIPVLTAFVFLALSMPVGADNATNDLRKEIQTLKQRVSDLEQKPGTTATESVPFSAMEHLQNQMDQALDDAFNSSNVFTNGMFNSKIFYEASPLEPTKDGYQMKLNVSGFDKNDIKVSAHNGMLTVTGQTSAESGRQSPHASSSTQNFGAFMNKISLPADADSDAISTNRSGNQLTITIPKKT